MEFGLDEQVKTPIYRQIRDQVVAAIAAGELKEGDALPPVRALAAELGVNHHTVYKGYAALREEGYLVMNGPAGSRVALPVSGDEASRRLARGLEALIADFKASGGARTQLEQVVLDAIDDAYGEGARR